MNNIGYNAVASAKQLFSVCHCSIELIVQVLYLTMHTFLVAVFHRHQPCVTDVKAIAQRSVRL